MCSSDLLAAYPELGCTGGPYEVWRQWGVSEDVLCAGNDQVLKFLEDVYAELIEIFPSEYIHVGGDECPKVRWEKCPKCQARIKALGLKSDDKHSKEERLQSFVINHIEKFLNDHGRQIIGGREGPANDLASDGAAFTGFAVYKYILDKEHMAGKQDQWPYLRLPEIYLSYAEALNEVGRTSDAYQ